MPRFRTIRIVLASAVVFACVAVGGATPAYAAVSNGFDITYGNSYTRGTLTWYNRSIGVSGNVKTTDGNCRLAQISALVDTEFGPRYVGNFLTEGACSYVGEGSVIEPISGTINTNTPGAADYIEVCFYGAPLDAEGDYPLIKCQNVYHP